MNHVRNLSTSLKRKGMSVLTVVLLFALIIGVLVFAMHSLWQGSSRTMFSVQEHRQLINLARSCLSEAFFELQLDLDTAGRAEVHNWFTSGSEVASRSIQPAKTREFATAMTSVPGTNPGNLQFTVDTIKVRRTKGLPPGFARYTTQGVIDFEVGVTVTRLRPKHEAHLKMIERRNFSLLRVPRTRYLYAPKVVISATPLATWIEDGVQQ